MKYYTVAITLILLLVFTGCKTGFLLKRQTVSYSGQKISASEIVYFRPLSVYMEVDVPFLKKKFDSSNYLSKLKEFDDIAKEFAYNNSFIYTEYDTVRYDKVKFFLANNLLVKGTETFDMLKAASDFPHDNKARIFTYARFERSLNFGSVTVPSPYLTSEITVFLLVFRGSEIIHSTVYYNRVNDGFPPNKDVKPYFQEAQMKDVIEKSMRDFMKHVKKE